MSLALENEFLTVLVAEKGAEITSLRGKKYNAEYIWTGDAAYWGRHAPILFPIVGRVKNNEYRVGNKTYKLGQHGFARDFDFRTVEKNNEKALFRLCWSGETLKLYPYKFELDVEYSLRDSTLEVTYTVKNTDSRDIYFSIGAHPGFNCPFINAETGAVPPGFEDYYLEFEKKETADTAKINSSGLIKSETEPFLDNTDRIPLSHSLFSEDALVLGNLKSRKVSLKNTKNDMGISFDFTGFPYLGIWSKPEGAPFVCIEPWFGHADYEDFDGDFSEKEGVIRLGTGQDFSCKFSIAVL
jgi:galactose mutarotase-like enzyme